MSIIMLQSKAKQSKAKQSKSMSAPIIVWIEKWQRFVVFYANMSESSPWSINYIVENYREQDKGAFTENWRCDEFHGGDSCMRRIEHPVIVNICYDSNTEYYEYGCDCSVGNCVNSIEFEGYPGYKDFNFNCNLEFEGEYKESKSLLDSNDSEIYSNWNPFTINCDQKYIDDNGDEKFACLLIYNKISTFSNTINPDSLAVMDFKVLIPKGYGEFEVIDPIKDNSDWVRKGYGHYSLPAPHIFNGRDPKGNFEYYYNQNILDRVIYSAMKTNHLSFGLAYRNGKWNLSTATSGINFDSGKMRSRTGISMTLNKETDKYRYLWIKE